ncbi:MAG: lysophospholipid acyltransferase family protein [Eubacteriales bacterium]|nr:lysophospholipid acyltransferase family protein [Eubacteriales bacterium]
MAESKKTKDKLKSRKISDKVLRHTALRHNFVFWLLRPFLKLYLLIRYNYHAKEYLNKPDQQPPYFILSSHSGALDPFMLAQSFRHPIYFVASDHLFRLGWISRLISYLVAPVPIVKSQIDLQAMRKIISINQEGGNICLFPSGNRSFVGPELPIPEATGKLIRHMRCTVLLYRFEGGYLSTPRWAHYERRGKMSGRVVRVLSKEEIAQMTPVELNQIILQELETNPYRTPTPRSSSQSYQKFKGRRLAEYLERVLFACPSCREFSTLRSNNNTLSCSCGFNVQYRPDGHFDVENSKYRYIVERLPDTAAFDRFQRELLANLLQNPANRRGYLMKPLFSDDNERLFKTLRATKNQFCFQGRLEMYSDRLVISNEHESLEFMLCSIGGMSVHGPQVLQFYAKETDSVYELKSDSPRSAYKYVVAYEMLKTYCKGLKEEAI